MAARDLRKWRKTWIYVQSIPNLYVKWFTNPAQVVSETRRSDW